MKRDILSTLIAAAEQGPETPQLVKALRLARKEQARKSPALLQPRSYDIALANTNRALECIADGLRWAADMRAKNEPKEKIFPIVLEQNKKAARLLDL